MKKFFVHIFGFFALANIAFGGEQIIDSIYFSKFQDPRKIPPSLYIIMSQLNDDIVYFEINAYAGYKYEVYYSLDNKHWTLRTESNVITQNKKIHYYMSMERFRRLTGRTRIYFRVKKIYVLD